MIAPAAPASGDSTNALEAEVDQVIALCNGDERATIRALIVTMQYLEDRARRLHADVSRDYFRERSNEQSLSTLVHEMTHLDQRHFGKPSRAGYHNKEWAKLMRDVGLIPSDTGAPGDKEVGQRVSHYIEAGGRFERTCATC
jgi:hypothetical protein